jgi:hypothetical protein
MLRYSSDQVVLFCASVIGHRVAQLNLLQYITRYFTAERVPSSWVGTRLPAQKSPQLSFDVCSFYSSHVSSCLLDTTSKPWLRRAPFSHFLFLRNHGQPPHPFRQRFPLLLPILAIAPCISPRTLRRAWSGKVPSIGWYGKQIVSETGVNPPIVKIHPTTPAIVFPYPRPNIAQAKRRRISTMTVWFQRRLYTMGFLLLDCFKVIKEDGCGDRRTYGCWARAILLGKAAGPPYFHLKLVKDVKINLEYPNPYVYP